MTTVTDLHAPTPSRRDRLTESAGVIVSAQRVMAEARRQRCAGFAAILACALVAALSISPLASASPTYAPKNGKIWHGVSDTGSVKDYRRFNEQVRAHTPLNLVFFHWGIPLTTALERWDRMNARGILSLSTAPGGQPEVISPKQIALGRDDGYPLGLNKSIVDSGQTVFIRPFAEMNIHFNPYSAFDVDGTPRPGHETKWFKLAWKRLVLIVRGGKRNAINHKLRDLGMPRIYRAKSNDANVYDRLDVPRVLGEPKVAFMWMPLTRGSPDVPGNEPNAYFPGRKYVDWVGTDTYAKYANSTLWRLLNRFYNHKRGYPFAIGEYAPWDNDYNGDFVRRIHKWARERPRVKALVYYRSVNAENEFNLQFWPAARDALRQILNGPQYDEYAPGTRR